MKDIIAYEDFAKLDIRVATITAAERVPEADKLIKLQVDLGSQTRQIMAGIAQYIEDPQTLVGKQVPILVNLAPRTMRGYESQGMMLAAGDDTGAPVLLHPEHPLPNGSSIY